MEKRGKLVKNSNLLLIVLAFTLILSLSFASASLGDWFNGIFGDNSGITGNIISGAGSGLVACYPFNSDVIDTIGTYPGNSKGVTFTTGKIGNAVSFPGTTAANVTLPTNLIKGRSEFSISFWMKSTGTADGIISIAKDGTYNDEFLLYDQSTLKLIVNSASSAVTLGATVSDGQWKHIVIVYSNITGKATLYVNGAVKNSPTISKGPIDVNSIVIGQHQGNSGGAFNSAQSYLGLIDEFAVYNRVLTASEVTQLYNSGNGLVCPGTVQTCQSWSYSAWSACTNGVQTRTLIPGIPSGCSTTGITGADPLTQSCSTTTPVCQSWSYSAWSACTNGVQTRTLIPGIPSGCTTTGVTGNDPLTQSCSTTAPTCTSYTYSAWSACTNGVQTRTATGSPSGCTGGSQAALTQSCSITSSTNPGICTCNSGSDCNSKLADPACGEVKLIANVNVSFNSILFGYGQYQKNNTVFNCQGYLLYGKLNPGAQAILYAGNNNTIKNCFIDTNAIGIYVYNTPSGTNSNKINDSSICRTSPTSGTYAIRNDGSNTNIATTKCDSSSPGGLCQVCPTLPPPTTNVCSCNSCGTCTTALNNPACTIVNLTNDIVATNGANCINLGTTSSSTSGKTFDCQNYHVNSSGAETIVIRGNDNIVKNCNVGSYNAGIWIASGVDNDVMNSNICQGSSYDIISNTASGSIFSGVACKSSNPNGACSIACPTPSAACVDTDSGTNLLAYGSVSNGTAAFSDTCVSSTSVGEAYCQGTNAKSLTYSCPGGYSCSNGACLSTTENTCSDSDNGQTTISLGTATNSSGVSMTDSCSGTSAVTEAYCSGNAVITSVVSCAPGSACTGGRCVAANACTGFTYGDWSACNATGVQTRTVTLSTPSGCLGGNPITIQSCTPLQNVVCLDNDGGNNAVTAGSAGNGTIVVADSCVSGTNQVYEAICSGDAVTTTISGCASGETCSAGACVSNAGPTCIDVDGSNSTTNSTTSNSTLFFADVCEGNSVREGICSGTSVTNNLIACGSGQTCSAGKCIAGNSISCVDPDAQNLTTSTVVANATSSLVDSCFNGNVSEAICSGTAISTISLACPDSGFCNAGKCLPSSTCIDGDNQSASNVSLAFNSTVSLTDVCRTTTSVNESICSGSSVIIMALNCGSGQICSEGRCVNGTTSSNNNNNNYPDDSNTGGGDEFPSDSSSGDNSDNLGGDSGNTTGSGTFIWVLIAVLVILIVAAVVVYILYRNKNKRRMQPLAQSNFRVVGQQ